MRANQDSSETNPHSVRKVRDIVACSQNGKCFCLRGRVADVKGDFVVVEDIDQGKTYDLVHNSMTQLLERDGVPVPPEVNPQLAEFWRMLEVPDLAVGDEVRRKRPALPNSSTPIVETFFKITGFSGDRSHVKAKRWGKCEEELLPIPDLKRLRPEKLTGEHYLASLLHNNTHPLSKRIALTSDNSLDKTPIADMYDGRADLLAVHSIRELIELRADASVHEALCMGIPRREDGHVPSALIRTKKGFDELVKSKSKLARVCITRTKLHFTFHRGRAILMVDFDPAPGQREVPWEEVEALWCENVPGYRDVGRAWVQSVSGGIYLGDRLVSKRGSMRLYLGVDCGTNIPFIGRLLAYVLFEHGYGFVKSDDPNSATGTRAKHPACPVDLSVWSPERIDYCSRPILGNGLEQYLDEPRFMGGDPLSTERTLGEYWNGLKPANMAEFKLLPAVARVLAGMKAGPNPGAGVASGPAAEEVKSRKMTAPWRVSYFERRAEKAKKRRAEFDEAKTAILETREREYPTRDSDQTLSQEETERYRERALDLLRRKMEELAIAPAGHRNKTLNAVVFALGAHVRRDIIDRHDELMPEVRKACERNGYLPGNETSFLRTIKSALDASADHDLPALPSDEKIFEGADVDPIDDGATGEAPGASAGAETDTSDFEDPEANARDDLRKQILAAQAVIDNLNAELKSHIGFLMDLPQRVLAKPQEALEPVIVRGLAALKVLDAQKYAEHLDLLRSAKTNIPLLKKEVEKEHKKFHREHREAVAALAALQPKAAPVWVQELNKKHALIVYGRNAVIINEEPGGQRVDFWTPDAFRMKYLNKTIPMGDEGDLSVAPLWMKSTHRRDYERIDFCPGENPKDVFNLWRGFAIDPSEKGSCEKFKTHLFDNVCQGNKELYNWLWTWLADIIQNPGRKSGICVVLKSEAKGTGKSKVGDVTRVLIGSRHSVKLGKKKEVVGDFNAHFESAIFAQVEEALFAGDKPAKCILDDLITSDTIGIERKGIDRIEVKSATRFLVTSNAKRAVLASADERRLAVFEVGSARAQDHAYFAAIDAELKEGGYERLMYELLKHQFNGVDPTIAPKTEGLCDQKLQSLDTFSRWWLDELQDGGLWQENSEGLIQIETATFRKKFGEFEGLHRHDSRPMSQEDIGRELKRLLGGRLKTVRPTAETSGRRPRQYQIPDLRTCREKFEELLGHSLAWDNS